MDNKGFIDDKMFFGKIPGTGQPAAMNQTTREINPAYLDSMINNPNEHPEVRKNAFEMKRRLFPELVEVPVEVEEDVPEVEEKPKPKPKKKSKSKKKTVKKDPPKKVENPITESKHIPPVEFAQFLQQFSSEIYSDEVHLLSSSEHVVQLRSMTVEEYKYLSKQLEVFDSRIEDLDKSDVEYRQQVKDLEFSLTNALDVVLRRCIVNDFAVENLSVYDWIYLLVYIRLLSRGEEANFRITVKDMKTKESKTEYIDINLSELLDCIKNNSETFSQNPIDCIDVGEGVSLYLMTPTRGDMLYVQQQCLRNPEASMSIMSIAMCVKAFVKDGVANIMSPDQRVQLVNSLSYDHLREITEAYEENRRGFFDVINGWIREHNEGAEDFEVSDFILFFYDF